VRPGYGGLRFDPRQVTGWAVREDRNDTLRGGLNGKRVQLLVVHLLNPHLLECGKLQDFFHHGSSDTAQEKDTIDGSAIPQGLDDGFSSGHK
jgi:hypothetical protein